MDDCSKLSTFDPAMDIRGGVSSKSDVVQTSIPPLYKFTATNNFNMNQVEFACVLQALR